MRPAIHERSVCSLTIVVFWKCLCLKIFQFQTLNFVADIVQWSVWWAGANLALLSAFFTILSYPTFTVWSLHSSTVLSLLSDHFRSGPLAPAPVFLRAEGPLSLQLQFEVLKFFFIFLSAAKSLSYSVKLKSPDYTANLSEPVQLKQINMSLLSHSNQKEKLPYISSVMWLCKQTNTSL